MPIRYVGRDRPTAVEDPTAAGGFEAALDALAHPQRRRLLLALLERDQRDDRPVVATPSGTRSDAASTVAIDREQLSRLVDDGFVDREGSPGAVTAGPAFGEVRPLLELVADYDVQPPDVWL